MGIGKEERREEEGIYIEGESEGKEAEKEVKSI